MPKYFSSYLPAAVIISLAVSPAFAANGEIIVQTEELSLSGQRQQPDGKQQAISPGRHSGKVIVTDKILFTGRRNRQQ